MAQPIKNWVTFQCSLSKIELLSNASNDRKIWSTGQRTFFRTFGEYRPWSLLKVFRDKKYYINVECTVLIPTHSCVIIHKQTSFFNQYFNITQKKLYLMHEKLPLPYLPFVSSLVSVNDSTF